MSRDRSCKERVSGICKNLHLIILEGVLINGSSANELQFFLRIGIAPIPEIRLNRLTSKNADYIF